MLTRRTGVSEQRELKLLSKAGKEVWTSISANPFFDLDGNYNGSLAMVSDITEAKSLRLLLDKAIKISRMGTYEMDLMQNKLYWSEMTKEIHELPINFVPNIKTAIDFYKLGPSRDAVSNAVANATKNGTSFDLEVQIVTAKGNLRWVRTIGQADCVNGKCLRLYGSFQDVDKVKSSELEVLKAYEEKNGILESIGDAFFAVDKDWTITYWNNKAETVLQKDRKDLLHKNLWEIFPDVVGTTMYSNYHAALAENKARHFEAYYEAMDIWFEVSAYPSFNGLSVFLKILQNVRLQKRSFTN
ncbi:PAS domain-containing protein [Mucilaginibacter antarcticus]|uniref:PAS domain-containing protein n=1 Tax=Mucilaginibacter antarcticus TaxID=1855725 RepID=UPI00363ED2C7